MHRGGKLEFKHKPVMLNECIEVGRKSSDKLFTLTVPTGGGKTISSMTTYNCHSHMTLVGLTKKR